MRAHYADSLLFSHSDGELFVLSGASVSVCTVGTSTPISEALYSGPTGETALTNPLTSGADGKIEFWLAASAQVDLVASKAGYSPITRTVEVGSPLFPYDDSVNPTVGDTLVYDGTKYVPQAPSGGGSGPTWSDPVTIIDADVLTLDQASVEIVPAPADANVLLLPLLVFIQQHGTNSYGDNPRAAHLLVGWGGVSAGDPEAGIAIAQVEVAVLLNSPAHIVIPVGTGVSGAGAYVVTAKRVNATPGPGLAISLGAEDVVAVTPSADRSLTVWTLYQRIALPS